MGARSSAWWVLVGLASALVVPTSAVASHHIFSSSMDRFEMDGNSFGPSDGTPDFVDEFDNGTIAPDWAPLLGTHVEAGGVVTFQNPGTDITLGSVTFDVSNIEHETAVEDSMGDFTATSFWVPTLPNSGTEFHFQLYGVGPIIENAGLTVGNGTAGPFVSEQLTQAVGLGSFTTLQSETVTFNPGDVTGQIVLRLTYDDTANTVTGSFSLDGGTTFQNPFSPMSIFGVVSDYEFLLGAGAVEESMPGPTPTPTTPGPTPTPTPLPTPQMVGAKLLLVKNPSGATARKIIYKVKQFGPTIPAYPPSSGATFHLQLDASSQCFPMPFYLWEPRGSGYSYTDRYGIYGPVKKAKIKRSPNGVFQIKINISGQLGPVNIIPPNPGSEANTNFAVGAAEYCSSTANGAINPNNAKTFKSKNAPPPIACNIPACP